MVQTTVTAFCDLSWLAPGFLKFNDRLSSDEHVPLSISQLPKVWPNTTGDAHEAFICQRASTHSDLIWDASHISTTRQNSRGSEM